MGGRMRASLNTLSLASIFLVAALGAGCGDDDAASGTDAGAGGLDASRTDASVVAGDAAVVPAVDAGTSPKGVLGADDFTYLGSYPVNNQSGLVFGTGLTLRYVSGQLRFLAFSYDTGSPAILNEFALPDGSDGATTAGNTNPAVDSLTGTWRDIWSPAPGPNVGGGDHYGIWWEEMGASGRLWTTRATDYPDDTQSMHTQAITVRELVADGTVTNVRGEYGLAGIGQRAIYGGVARVPATFQAEAGITQPYLVGWGGYSSRMAQGLTPSMGLMVVAIPDVSLLPPNPTGVVVPAADFRVLADHRSGSTNATDWYASWVPGFEPPFDRGARNTNVVNYFDGGDDRPNGMTGSPPPGAPLAGAQWDTPAPDGRGRMVWGDSFNATGNWIEGADKRGLVTVLTGARDKAWYCNSMLCSESIEIELQIFDPAQLIEVLRGTREAWNVQPVASRILTTDAGPGPRGRVVGAAFDERTRVLWLLWTSFDGAYGSRLLAYRVAS